MTEPLKPCPFCGNVPDVNNPATFQHETGSRWASVVCCVVGPEIRAGIYTPLEEWKDEAIAVWNERAQSEEAATLQARIDELQSLVDAYAQRVTDQDAQIATLLQREGPRGLPR